MPALDRARGAVSKSDRSDAQMSVECEPVGWFARRKVDQMMPQILTPDRSHCSHPSDWRGRPILEPLCSVTALFGIHKRYSAVSKFYHRDRTGQPPTTIILSLNEYHPPGNGPLVGITHG